MPAISFFDAFRSISQSAAPTAMAALWQGAVIAVGLFVCVRLTPRISAAHRFWLWGCGFAMLVCLPLLSSFAQLSQSSSADFTGLGAAPTGGWLELNIRWAIAITTLWTLGSLLRALDLFVHSFRLFRLWQDATPIEDSPVDLTAFPARRRFELCRTRQLDRPSVIGFFRPRILIPDWLVDRLTPSELQQIVLHEVEHLHRGDDWTNLFQKLCLIIFPLNPALAWIEHRLCREREMACDEAVIRATRAPRAYAACLTSLAERGLRRRAEALSLGAWQRRAELVSRIHRILGRPQLMSPLATRAILGGLSCGLIFGAFELARCPQFVAFIPDHPHQLAQQHVQSIDDLPHAVNASYTRDLASPSPARFRVVNTVARTPVSSAPLREKSVKVSRRAHHSVALPAMARIDEAPAAQTEQLRRRIQPGRDASQQHNQSQEWLVLTTWEQVVTTTSRTVSDSGDPENSAPMTEQKTQPSSSATRQITVTRLILRVAPANSAPNQPDAMPLMRDGWFVFQL